VVAETNEKVLVETALTVYTVFAAANAPPAVAIALAKTILSPSAIERLEADRSVTVTVSVACATEAVSSGSTVTKVRAVRPALEAVGSTTPDVSVTRNFKGPETIVEVSFAVSEKVDPVPDSTAYSVPVVGASDTKLVSARPFALAGSRPKAETTMADAVPIARLFRVRFLDMCLFLSWFPETLMGSGCKSELPPTKQEIPHPYIAR
jgi:hypothetical protein